MQMDIRNFRVEEPQNAQVNHIDFLTKKDALNIYTKNMSNQKDYDRNLESEVSLVS